MFLSPMFVPCSQPLMPWLVGYSERLPFCCWWLLVFLSHPSHLPILMHLPPEDNGRGKRIFLRTNMIARYFQVKKHERAVTGS